MTKFDGNLAWKHASAAVRANRHLLLALAGVFFFLPSFALIMLAKQPQVPPGATPEQMMVVLQPFIQEMAPWFVVGSIVQALGQLTLFELFGRSERATVGEALRAGLAALPSYVVVQLLTGFAMTFVLFLVMGVAGLVSPLIGLAVGIYIVCLAYGRFVTAGAVIIVERQKNPFTAIGRAVALTRGNGFRVGNFLFLLAISFFVAFMVLTLVIGILTALTMGEGRGAEILTGFVSSAATALAVSYFAAITVAIHRQLMGRLAEQR
jgi:hypothetical protein